MSTEVARQPKPGKYEKERFYTLSAIAYSCLKDIQEDESRFEHFLHFAMEGYKELQFDFNVDVKVEIIPMKGSKQIDFPCDMIDWIKVGFQCGNFIKVLTRDTNTAKTFDHDEDCVAQENAACPDIGNVSSDIMVPFFGFFDGAGFDKMFGMALQYNYLGYFSVDWHSRVINFKDTVTNQRNVYLEYITDGINPTGPTVVPAYAFKTIKNYVHWQRKLHDDKYGDGTRKEAERIYDKSLTNLEDRLLDITVDDIKEALRAGYRMTPKN